MTPATPTRQAATLADLTLPDGTLYAAAHVEYPDQGTWLYAWSSLVPERLRVRALELAETYGAARITTTTGVVLEQVKRPR